MPDRILTNQAGSLHGMRITAQPAGGLNRQRYFRSSLLQSAAADGVRGHRMPCSHARIGAAASKDHEPCRAASAGLRARPSCTSWRAAIPLPAVVCSGLDLSAPMFAPCLLGCPGTGRQNPVLMSLRLAGCGTAPHVIAFL